MQSSEFRRLASRAIGKVFFRFAPSKMKLPFYYWLHILEGSYENELKYLAKIYQGGNTAIDVGANEGLFSYVMSKHFTKVYAFEINDELTGYLEAYNPGNIEIINKGLSSKSGDAILYIPVRQHDGYALIGYASLAPGNYPDTTKHIKKNVSLCILDELNIANVEFIKIDVEGHELEVLKGSLQTLIQYRPVVLVEIKDENLEDVFHFFTELEFKKFKLEDLIGITSSRENYIFIPKEKVN